MIQPPVQATIDPAVDHTVMAVLGALAAVALLFALDRWRRDGRPIVALLLASGALMTLLEPFVDLVGGCWHPADATRAFTLWERPMPVWLCLAYVVYFGIGGGVAWLAVRRRPVASTLWAVFVVEMLGDVVLETTLLHWHTYVYYGAQPLVLARFPFWWAPVNALVGVVVAVLVVRAEPLLRGPRLLLIVPLALATSAAVNTVAGWPSWTAVNSDLGPAGQLGGVLTVVISLALVHLLTRWVRAWSPAPTPAALTGAVVEPHPSLG